MSYNGLLNTTTTIQQISSPIGRDSIGGPSRTWADLYASIPARIEILTVTEREILGRQGISATHRQFVQKGYTITERERAITGGVTFDIVGVMEMPAYSSVHHTELTMLRTD